MDACAVLPDFSCVTFAILVSFIIAVLKVLIAEKLLRLEYVICRVHNIHRLKRYRKCMVVCGNSHCVVSPFAWNGWVKIYCLYLHRFMIFSDVWHQILQISLTWIKNIIKTVCIQVGVDVLTQCCICCAYLCCEEVKLQKAACSAVCTHTHTLMDPPSL